MKEPRIKFIPTKSCKVRRDPDPRTVMEEHEITHAHYEDLIKAKIEKAEEKKKEKRLAIIGTIFWFLALSHILMLIEWYYIWR